MLSEHGQGANAFVFALQRQFLRHRRAEAVVVVLPGMRDTPQAGTTNSISHIYMHVRNIYMQIVMACSHEMVIYVVTHKRCTQIDAVYRAVKYWCYENSLSCQCLSESHDNPKTLLSIHTNVLVQMMNKLGKL